MAFWRQKHGWISLLLSVVVISLVLVSCTGTPTTAPTTIPTTATPTTTASPQPTQPQVIKWKAQTDFTATVAPYGPFKAGWTDSWGSIRMWSEWVTAATKGGLTIDWAAPGAIYPVTEAVNAVGKGTVQAGVSYGSYYAGQMPVAALLPTMPFVWDSIASLDEALYDYGLYDLLAKAFAERNVKWFPWYADSWVGLGTTFPLPNPEAVQGKKIRATGLFGDYVAMLGATPVNIPIVDTYMALKLGTVDGAVHGAGFFQVQAFKEVITNYVADPNITLAASDVMINMDAWNALPKDFRDQMELNNRHVLYSVSSKWHNQVMWVKANAEKDYGVKFWSWSEADKQRVIDMTVDKIFPSFAAKDATCAKAIEIIRKQMADYGKLKK